MYYYRIKNIEKSCNFTDKTIIDFWCGYNAKFLSYIYKNFKTKELIAFDLSLNKIYLDSLGIKYYEWDLNKDFIIKENIDIAIWTAVLEHLSNPVWFLKSCYKNLPKWWYLLLTVPSVWSKPVLEFFAYKLRV